MIEVENLTKKYNNIVAVKDISFKIEDGDVVGFLGPNGAGKTTTMNMITGYIEPTKGKIIINGYDIDSKPNEAKKQFGYLPENVPLYNDLTVTEFISFMAELKLVSKSERSKEVKRVIEKAGLLEVKKKLIRNLSRGYKQRVGLAGALVGNPKILILDEPTVGLDPKQVTEIRNFIKELGKDHTILISSHILSEISQMCNKVIILNKGSIIDVDTTENLEKKTTDNFEVVVTVEGNDCDLTRIKKSIPSIRSIERLDKGGDNETVYLVKCSDSDDIRKQLFKECAKEDITILEMVKKENSLEDAFLKIINTEEGGNK